MNSAIFSKSDPLSVSGKSSLKELLFLGIFFIFIFIGIRHFLVSSYPIDYNDMSPVLKEGDFTFYTKFPYGMPLIKAIESKSILGKVVLFEDEAGKQAKRVVGTSGDSVNFLDGKWQVTDISGATTVYELVGWGNEEVQSESMASFLGPLEVPKDHVFLVSDNLSQKFDSWSIVPNTSVVGKISLVWLSFSSETFKARRFLKVVE